MNKSSGGSRIARIILLLGALACIGSILWSFWVETLMPILQRGEYIAAGLTATAFLLFMIGAGCMVYSAYIFLRNTYRLFRDATFQQSVHIVQNRKNCPPDRVRQARKENLRALWLAWRPALPWMVLGWLIFAIGGVVIHLAEGKL